MRIRLDAKVSGLGDRGDVVEVSQDRGNALVCRGYGQPVEHDAPAADAPVSAPLAMPDASRSAIELAEANAVDIRLIQGTGKAGKVSIGDVRRYCAAHSG